MVIKCDNDFNVTITMSESELKEIYKGSFSEYRNNINNIVSKVLEIVDKKVR